MRIVCKKMEGLCYFTGASITSPKYQIMNARNLFI